MCGIAGRYSFENKKIFKKEIDLMTNQMIERGPDDSGSFVYSNFGIGMRRLSIIDVEMIVNTCLLLFLFHIT